MKTTIIISIIVYLLIRGYILNFENNACQNLLAYPMSELPISGCYVNPNPKIVKRNGFKIRKHSATTADGYVLTIFEISDKLTKNNPIFIQHGICANSMSWVDKGNRSIAFYLARKGYRVFLGNIRGTPYSKKHKYLSLDDPNYWDFNLDVLADKDMVTQLEYVYKKCGQKIHYIGHSMGSTLALMFASTLTDKANQWIQSLTFLAPVAYLTHVIIIELFKMPVLELDKVFRRQNVTGLFYNEDEVHSLVVSYCKALPLRCRLIIDAVAGKTKNFPDEDLLLFFSIYPSATSVYLLRQYLQFTESRRFQKYDYGRAKNLEMYGSARPPLYNLNNVKAPVCLFYAENDSLFKKENLERLYKEIGSANKCKHPIASSSGPYNHIDFLYSRNLSQDLYEKMLNFIEEHESK